MFTDDPETFTVYRNYPMYIDNVEYAIGEIIGMDYDITDAFEVTERLFKADFAIALAKLPHATYVSTENGYVVMNGGRAICRYEISETPKKECQ